MRLQETECFAKSPSSFTRFVSCVNKFYMFHNKIKRVLIYLARETGHVSLDISFSGNPPLKTQWERPKHILGAN